MIVWKINRETKRSALQNFKYVILGSSIELIGGVWSLDGKENLVQTCQVQFKGQTIILFNNNEKKIIDILIKI